MTLQELINLVRNYTDEPDTDVFTDSFITSLINQSYIETRRYLLSDLRNFGLAYITDNLSTSSTTFNLQSDMFTIEFVGIKDTSSDTYTQIKYVLPQNLLESGTNLEDSGTPYSYTQYSNILYFYPLPDKTYDLYIIYKKQITTDDYLVDLTDSPTLVPDELHNAIAFKAASYMTHHDEADRRWQVFESAFAKAVGDYISNLGQRFKDEDRYVYLR